MLSGPMTDIFLSRSREYITVLPDGSSRFDLSANGKHRYLVLTAEQRTRTLEAMILLASQPPARRNRAMSIKGRFV